MSRLEKLKEMLVADPDDTFLQYAIAMEQRSAGNVDESEAGFRALAERNPPYVPACFMLGQLLAGENRIEESRSALRNGISHARTQNEHHAAGEMSEFLATLGSMGE